VFIVVSVYFVIDPVRKLLVIPSYVVRQKPFSLFKKDTKTHCEGITERKPLSLQDVISINVSAVVK
jgi:hypothetical protein